jgi:hypothetical protein
MTVKRGVILCVVHREQKPDPNRMERKCHRYQSGGGGEHMVEWEELGNPAQNVCTALAQLRHADTSLHLPSMPDWQ